MRLLETWRPRSVLYIFALHFFASIIVCQHVGVRSVELRFAKDLFHRAALGEFIDQFVEVAGLLG